MKNKIFFILLLLICNYKLFSQITKLDPAPIEYNLVDTESNLLLHPFSEKIGHTWVNGMVWDKPLIKKFYLQLKQAKKPFVVFDIGAQTGSFSLLAKFFPHSQWYSFEPIEEAAYTLKANLALNAINNVTVIQQAVSNFNGPSTLKMPNLSRWGLSTLGNHPLRFDTYTERNIECLSIDNFVFSNGIEQVDYIKIDTEGSELNILKGAEGVIKQFHPIILLEYNETNMAQCDVSKDQLDAFLQSHEYEWKLISSEDILCFPKQL